MPFIACALIDVIDKRDDAEDSLDGLIGSIERHGLLAPVIVAPSTEVAGRFEVLAGARRLAAALRAGLKRVECKVLANADEIEREMVRITENAHRLELTGPKRAEQMLRYADLIRQLAARKAAYEAQEAPHEADEPPSKPVEAKAPTPPRTRSAALAGAPNPAQVRKAPEPDIVNKVAEDLGVAPRTVQRILRRGEIFTDAERETLVGRGISQDRQNQIAGITDPQKRTLVIECIADGASFTNAMLGILGDKFKVPEHEMSDAEWLATLPLMRVQINLPRFRSDALLYRRIQQLRISFAKEIGWAKLKDDIAEKGALYYRRLWLFLDSPHPRDWIKCSGCTAGMQSSREHIACRGNGYLIN